MSDTVRTLLNRAEFVLAAHELHQLPADEGVEVAIAGRSNAGKSTALNALCGRRGLARTSKTPGRTQQLVVFDLAAGRRLIDLPGYGFAQVPEAIRAHWGDLLARYFASRQSLAGLMVVMDIRHPLKPHDHGMLEYARAAALPTHVLLTKADKLGRGARGAALADVKKRLAAEGFDASLQLFSAPEGLGLDEARAVLGRWLRAGAGAGQATTPTPPPA